MTLNVNILGTIIGILIAIFLIFKKVSPFYSMTIATLLGLIISGVSLDNSINIMVEGAKNILPAIFRVLAAGMLAGVLTKSQAALVIAKTLINNLGEKHALNALVLTTAILTGIGIFVDVAVITVAPIAISIAKKLNLSKSSILLAMVGGGKSGNLISPNPNTIAAAQSFNLNLTTLMFAGMLPALIGILTTCFLASKIKNPKNTIFNKNSIEEKAGNLPSFKSAIVAPVTTIILLLLKPLFSINIDPMIALPIGSLVGTIAMKKTKEFNTFITSGLNNMTEVAIMLLGTGALAGLISNSDINALITTALINSNIPTFLLAPLSGTLMSAATSSTTAATTIASQVFGPTILSLNIQPLNAAIMIHAGAAVFDHLPHGSFFHATANSVNMNIKKRLNLILYETIIGIAILITTIITFGVLTIF